MKPPPKSDTTRERLNEILNWPPGGRIWEYWIPYPFESGNVKEKAHWGVKARHSKQCREDMGYSVMAVGKPTKPLKSAALFVHRVAHNRADDDNLGKGFKPFRDGLKDAEVIHDDATKYLKHTKYTDEIDRDKTRQGTWVWVVEMPERNG